MAEFQRESKSFSQALDFTRPDPGTYWDASGALKTAAVDEPRFTHDPVTLEPLGLLIEEQRTNLLLWGEAFDDAAWNKVGSSISAEVEQAPDGNLTADKLIESAAESEHYAEQNITPSAGDFTFSVFAKEAERSVVELDPVHVGESTSVSVLRVDLTDGSILHTSGLITDTKVVKHLNGWYLIQAVVPISSATTSLRHRVRLYDDGSVYLGDGTSGIYLWGAQLEQGTFPTSYIKTEASQVTRSADNCSRTLGSEFNASEGRIEVTATANAGDTVIALGTESIVADVDTEKTYTLTYNADPSATTMDILPGATGTAKSVKYYPRETA